MHGETWEKNRFISFSNEAPGWYCLKDDMGNNERKRKGYVKMVIRNTKHHKSYLVMKKTEYGGIYKENITHIIFRKSEYGLNNEMQSSSKS